MAERVGKIGLNAGTPWSLFAENTAFEDTEGLVHPKGINTEAARLHKEDMRLFGVCPAKDGLVLAVCKECKCILQVSSLITHYERKHPKVLSSIKRSPTRICSVTKEILSPSHTFGKSKLLKSPGDNSFIRIEEVDPTDINVKIEEVPLTIPNFNHTAKGKIPKINLKNVIGNKAKAGSEKQTSTWKGQHKKQIINKDKEYDPERHCGVWIEEQTRNCTRSLTCKTHSLASRREVSGRSKVFDALLADYKLRVQSNKESGSSSGTNTPTATPSPTRSNPPNFTLKSERRLSSATDPRSPSSKDSFRSEAKKHSLGDDHTSPFTQIQPTYVDYICEDHSSSIQTISYHPKPLAVNNFSARRIGSGCYSFNKKFHSFRLAAQTMVDQLIKANSNTVNSQQLSYKRFSAADGICSTQVLDEGVSTMDTSNSFTLNSSSTTEPSRFGPVPRVKTKVSKENSQANLKRQVSDSFLSEHYSSSRKRRHSADALKNEFISKDGSLSDNIVNDSINLKDPTAVDLAKCVNELGQALQGFDVESLDGNFLSGALLCTDSAQSGISNLTITGGNITANLNTNIGLNSSLSLCQTMGINQGLPQNLSINLAGSQNVVVDQGQVVNHMVAPNVAVTQGMMVSLPNVTQVQNLAAYQGNLKEILPAPGVGNQQSVSPGVFLATQGQQPVSQLANGTVSSPETFSIAYSPGQSIASANINASIRAANSSTSATKRLAVSGPSRVSQLVVRQPSQQLQNYHKDTNNQRSSPFQKPAPFDSRKAPSPSQAVQNPVRSPSQQTNLVTTSTQLLSNTPQYSSTSQPIAQLKQMQIQQLQQQSMISPLNSAMQAESLSYQQQILPKLVVSPNRNLPAQIVSSQTLQVASQHLQQRSVLEPSTP